MHVSIIVPVYNEQENIEPLAQELQSQADKISDMEAIFVDDGSDDKTWENIKACQKKFSAIRGIRYEVNRGQSAAMLVGLQNANGDILVTIDGDMQNDPADIPKLLAEMKDSDVVCGYRADRKDTWARRVGSKMANTVRGWVTHDGIRDTGCSLKAFKKECVSDLPPVKGVHRFMPAYFKLNGRKIKEVAVGHRPRTLGTSKYTNMKRLPGTVHDLVGFAWYRKKYRLPVKKDELEII